MSPPKGRILKVTKTRRAISAEAEAARKEKVRERTIKHILDGTYERIYEETGVDLLVGTEFGPPLPPRPSVDAGAGRDELNESCRVDTRTPSQALSDHIRSVLNDPERRKERMRLKRGGSHDARAVPEDAPAAVSYPRVPWER